MGRSGKGRCGAMTVKVKAIGIALALLLTILLPSLVAGEPDENIHCTGTVRDTWVHLGGREWEVAVEEVISGPQSPCNEVKVNLMTGIYPFTGGYFDPDIAIGDHVDVYGLYNHSQCRVSLNENSNYHITKIAVPVTALTPLGLVAVVGVLASVAMSKIVRRKRR
jgi:hypothetical protein